MALPVRDQLKYWGIAAAVFLIVLWFLGNVLLPFVLGGAIAYFLDPVADRLERAGLSRAAATATITISAVLFFVIMAVPAALLLGNQIERFVSAAPELLQGLQDTLRKWLPTVFAEDRPLSQSLEGFGTAIQDRGGALLNALFASANSLINLIVLAIIVPVVAVYMLLDWDRMVARVDALLPRDHIHTIRHLAREIDDVLSSFIRGMGTVCLILGTYYAVALMLVGLQFGLVVGFIAGMVTFIPYLGALIGGALALGLAFFQYWNGIEVTLPDGSIETQTDWVRIVIVYAIFQSGQMIEGNYLTPRLVGGSVGLHPVWLLFSLSVFGALFGFIGLLVAVPVAAALGVLARFLIELYTDSKLYRGLDDQGPE